MPKVNAKRLERTIAKLGVDEKTADILREANEPSEKAPSIGASSIERHDPGDL